MYQVRTEMASGAISRGYTREEFQDIEPIFTGILGYLRATREELMQPIDVVLLEDGIELKRERV